MLFGLICEVFFYSQRPIVNMLYVFFNYKTAFVTLGLYSRNAANILRLDGNNLLHSHIKFFENNYQNFNVFEVNILYSFNVLNLNILFS